MPARDTADVKDKTADKPALKESDSSAALQEASVLLANRPVGKKPDEPAVLDLAQGNIYTSREQLATPAPLHDTDLSKLPADFGPDRRPHPLEADPGARANEKFYGFDERFNAATDTKMAPSERLILRDGLQKLGEQSKDQIRDLAKEHTFKAPANFESPEKTKLSHDAEEKFKNQPEKLKAFKDHMKELEDRAGKQNLSPEEIAKTYKNIDRLLEAKGDKPLSEQRRKDLAEQVMSQAAKPSSIDQGMHGTCSVNSAEVRAYTKNPSDAAALVADVATTGQYKTKEGQTFKINPVPHDESRTNPPAETERSHASEIFQVTAGNIIADKLGKSMVPPQTLRYEQRKPGPNDTGEYVVSYNKNGPVESRPFSVPFGTENAAMLPAALKAITGKSEPGTFVGRDTYVPDKSPDLTIVKSEQDLIGTLEQAKKDGKFPITVFVHSGNEPFWTDSNGAKAGGSGGGHVLNITDYNLGPPAKVTLDNSWGPKADHDSRNPVTVSDLYSAMQDPAKSIAEVRKTASDARAAGHPDHYKEFDAIRMEHDQGKTSSQVIEQKLIMAMEAAKRDWDKHTDTGERAAAIVKLKAVIDSMDTAERTRLQERQKKLGLL